MRPTVGRYAEPRRRWRPGWLLILTIVVAVIGATILAYSPAASWLASYNQSLVVSRYNQSIAHVKPRASEQLAEARRYNSDLSAGAVLERNTRVPTGSGSNAGKVYDYWRLLNTPNGTMSRIQIPKIGVDLPIYHGTSDASLLKGAGHLQGTSLPVGGTSTHAVITAHRGLAEATMFTELDKLRLGDRFILTTFGRVLAYRVISTRVVAPEDTTTLWQRTGEDLVTLVTCTPLGINSQRILVTGERVTPAPASAVARGHEAPAGPGFPWWAAAFAGAAAASGGYLWWSGRGRGGRRA